MCVSLYHKDEITGQERNFMTALATYTLKHESDAKIRTYAIVAFTIIAIGVVAGLAVALTFSISAAIPSGMFTGSLWTGYNQECKAMRIRNKFFDACGQNKLLAAPILPKTVSADLKELTPETVENAPISKGVSESTHKFFISFCIQNVNTKECHVETLSEGLYGSWSVYAKECKVFKHGTFPNVDKAFELLKKLASGEIITKGNGDQFKLLSTSYSV